MSNSFLIAYLDSIQGKKQKGFSIFKYICILYKKLDFDTFVVNYLLLFEPKYFSAFKF